MTSLGMTPAEALERYSDAEITVWWSPPALRTGVYDDRQSRSTHYRSLRAALSEIMKHADQWGDIDIDIHASTGHQELSRSDLEPYFAELRRSAS